jgi:hypothetical protein
MVPHLELSPGIKLLQTLHSLLSVHHRSHSGALLWGEERSPVTGSLRGISLSPRETETQGDIRRVAGLAVSRDPQC